MPNIHANGIDIEYDTFGERSGRPLILIMGLITQMIGWPERFCQMLAGAGHFVVRFDNRDSGLSTRMEALGVPNLEKVMADLGAGKSISVPYTLGDMAGDTLGLMDALGIDRAHVCGLSMGGMIAQVMAIDHPERMASLVSMMSSTNEPDLPGPTPEATEAMMSSPPAKREPYIDYQAWVFRTFSGGSDEYDETFQRELSGRGFDRAFYPMGFARQMAAILHGAGRRNALGRVTVPALVIHGTHDALVPPEHGKDTADAIPGAKLMLVEGLGHGIAYPDLWPEIVSAIDAHTRENHGGT